MVCCIRCGAEAEFLFTGYKLAKCVSHCLSSWSRPEPKIPNILFQSASYHVLCKLDSGILLCCNRKMYETNTYRYTNERTCYFCFCIFIIYLGRYLLKYLKKNYVIKQLTYNLQYLHKVMRQWSLETQIMYNTHCLIPFVRNSSSQSRLIGSFLLQKECKGTVDKYVEYDTVIIMIDLILISRGAQRHVIYNTQFEVSCQNYISHKFHFVTCCTSLVSKP